MSLGLVEVKTKKTNYIKISICIAIALLVIGLSIFVAIHMAKKSQQTNQKMIAKKSITHFIQIPKVFNYETFKQNIASIYHSEEKRVFLTFDDGPSRAVTPFLLDTLKAQNVKATFFLLGSRVELAPDLVKREKEEGHYVANHGYSHKYDQIYISAQSVIDEYNATENAIRNALGDANYSSHLFRFPGGSYGGKHAVSKQEAIGLLDQNQIAHIDWNALTADSAGKHTKEEMLDYVKQTIGSKNNVVILMHDAGDKILTAELMPDLIDDLRQQGYEFKTMYDLM